MGFGGGGARFRQGSKLSLFTENNYPKIKKHKTTQVNVPHTCVECNHLRLCLTSGPTLSFTRAVRGGAM
ncbi:hypothetical protein KIMH_13340 [Bombiscardovia apis]|uniref:Uncharacterized protein n=1 Tax=Bombiscardovia apis TaxID=2932182 RepID=A0ABM8BEJ6_9BIFI|nr:hypothetical protein KIMH_13340 [Bombiscardovia apis]